MRFQANGIEVLHRGGHERLHAACQKTAVPDVSIQTRNEVRGNGNQTGAGRARRIKDLGRCFAIWVFTPLDAILPTDHPTKLIEALSRSGDATAIVWYKLLSICSTHLYLSMRMGAGYLAGYYGTTFLMPILE